MKVGFAKVRRNYHELCRFLGVLLFVCLFVLIHKDSLNQDMVNIRAILWLFFFPPPPPALASSMNHNGNTVIFLKKKNRNSRFPYLHLKDCSDKACTFR